MGTGPTSSSAVQASTIAPSANLPQFDVELQFEPPKPGSNLSLQDVRARLDHTLLRSGMAKPAIRAIVNHPNLAKAVNDAIRHAKQVTVRVRVRDQHVRVDIDGMTKKQSCIKFVEPRQDGLERFHKVCKHNPWHKSARWDDPAIVKNPRLRAKTNQKRPSKSVRSSVTHKTTRPSNPIVDAIWNMPPPNRPLGQTLKEAKRESKAMVSGYRNETGLTAQKKTKLYSQPRDKQGHLPPLPPVPEPAVYGAPLAKQPYEYMPREIATRHGTRYAYPPALPYEYPREMFTRPPSKQCMISIYSERHLPTYGCFAHEYVYRKNRKARTATAILSFLPQIAWIPNYLHQASNSRALSDNIDIMWAWLIASRINLVTKYWLKHLPKKELLLLVSAFKYILKDNFYHGISHDIVSAQNRFCKYLSPDKCITYAQKKRANKFVSDALFKNINRGLREMVARRNPSMTAATLAARLTPDDVRLITQRASGAPSMLDLLPPDHILARAVKIYLRDKIKQAKNGSTEKLSEMSDPSRQKKL